MELKFDEQVKDKNGKVKWVERTATYKRLPSRDMIGIETYEQSHRTKENGAYAIYRDKKMSNEFFRMMLDCDSAIDFSAVENVRLREMHLGFTATFLGLSKELQPTKES